MAGANTLTVDDQSFQEQVLNSPVPVLVDFWATWCGPCRAIAPVIDAVADQHVGKIRVAKVDVEQNQHWAQRYNISNIPAILFFQNGQVVDKVIGANPSAIRSAADRLAK